MLSIRNLSFSIGDKDILKDIQVEVKPDTFTAIIGPNGCGKSTLLAHLSGRRPSVEKVFFKGRAIERIDRRKLAREVAVMSQQQHFNDPTLKAEDIVLMGRYPYKKMFRAYEDKDYKIVEAMLDRVGGLGFLNNTLAELSGGERQRVLIAKALAQEPDLLLLDEPTNHLDISYKQELMRCLQSFSNTIVIVLHDLNLAYQYCDEVILMEKGRVVAQGTPGEVMTPEILESVFHVKFFSTEREGQHYLVY